MALLLSSFSFTENNLFLLLSFQHFYLLFFTLMLNNLLLSIIECKTIENKNQKGRPHRRDKQKGRFNQCSSINNQRIINIENQKNLFLVKKCRVVFTLQGFIQYSNIFNELLLKEAKNNNYQRRTHVNRSMTVRVLLLLSPNCRPEKH